MKSHRNGLFRRGRRLAQTFSLVALFNLVLALGDQETLAANILIPMNATWRYRDIGIDQGTAWRETNFNDTAWSAGPAQLGFGDADEMTIINGGVSGARYPTIYFRHSFVVADRSTVTNLALRVMRDDGVVVYLNGAEVFRSNMPEGPITYGSWSALGVSGGEESMFFSAPIAPALVRDGTNVVAVELHQSDLTSSDLSFVLELLANTPLGNLPPVVNINIAPAGRIVGSNEIFSISVNASDPETNVMRIDLMQDGVTVRSIFASSGDFTWSNSVAGIHEFTARATDATGMMGMSPSARVLARSTQFHGESVFFPQFSSANGLILQGTAAIGSNVLRLSPAIANTRGAAWIDTPQRVVDGFVSEFLFRITSRNNNGADGFAFVIAGAPQPAVGSGLLSYSGLTNSLAIEFDTFMNDSASDPNHFHISAHSRGASANTTDEGASLGLYMPANDFSDGMVHRVKIQYASGILRIFLDNLFVPILTLNVNLNTLLSLPDGRAWVGFTAGCGSNFENHDLWAWSYQSSIPLRIGYWMPESDGSIVLGFTTATGGSYVVEYSTNLVHWTAATPALGGTGALVLWRDDGPPGTESLPGFQPQRFYRVRVEH